MALRFDGQQDFINHGSATSLDNLDSVTFLMWLRARQVASSNRRWAWKNGGLSHQIGAGGGGNGQFMYFRDRATTATQADSAANTVVIDRWEFWAAFDSNGTAPQLYQGTRTASAVEVGYQVQQTGVGAVTSDAADNLLIGSRDFNNTFCDAEFAYLWVYNRRLTTGEALLHQFQPWLQLNGCVLRVSYWDTAASPSLRDLSGNGNHGTINNTPVAVAHVPLPHLSPPEWRGITPPPPAPAGWAHLLSDTRDRLIYVPR